MTAAWWWSRGLGPVGGWASPGPGRRCRARWPDDRGGASGPRTVRLAGGWATGRKRTRGASGPGAPCRQPKDEAACG